jgi:large subunit ribosomal protein L17
MRHLNAHRKLGRTSEHRMSMLRNLATSLINARDERIVTTVPKAKELRPFVERVITLAKRAGNLEGDDVAAQSLHLRRQAASFFHAGNRQQAASTGKRGQTRAPRTAGVAALKRLFDELGKRYAERPGGYTRIIRLGHRDGDNAELAIIELVDNPRERDAVAAESKRAKSVASGKKKTAKPGGKAETSSADSTKKEASGGRRSKKTESTAAEQETA